jgi:hypothetical protein
MNRKISIPAPCHEDLASMTPTEKGRFCMACQKDVIDFTRLTDKEVQATVMNNPGGCGIFLNSQLERELHIAKEKRKWMPAAAIAAGLLSLSAPAVAQDNNNVPAQEQNEPVENIVNPPVTALRPYKLTGVVNDNYGKPLKKVTVITASGKKVNTNSKGEFSIKVFPGEKVSFYYEDDLETEVLAREAKGDPLIVTIQLYYRTAGRYF